MSAGAANSGGSRMTLRVYRVTATGRRVTLSRRRTVRGEPGFFRSLLTDQWPDCACPRHAPPALARLAGGERALAYRLPLRNGYRGRQEQEESS
ncbi:hypothetical protein GCM10009665_20240 [Kitasatospora nipponensis]|uniref:Uncharacterized protein n=1 Tax=Kitasatospora nipponensis TaxID=258049 RepID=A0ABP4GQI0_9ACTN